MAGVHQGRAARVVRISVIPLAMLLVGFLVWQGSTAAFTTTTDNGLNSWQAGELELTNDGDTGTFTGSTTAVFSTTGSDLTTVPQKTDQLVPGSTGTKCIAVKALDTAPNIPVTFHASAVAGILAQNLTMTVTYGVSTAGTDALAHEACDLWIKLVAPTSAPASATGTAAEPTTTSIVVDNVALDSVATISSPAATTWTPTGVAPTAQYGLFLIQWTLDQNTPNDSQGETADATFNWQQTVGT